MNKSKKLLNKLGTKILENPKAFVDLALNLGLAYISYDMWKDPRAMLVGPIALKLAQSPNLAASVGGCATLGLMGLTHLGQAAKHSVEIPGTGIVIPQSLPDPLEWWTEAVEAKKRGEYKPMVLRM